VAETEVLKPFPANSMKAYPVSTRVGSPKNDDAAIIEELQMGATAPKSDVSCLDRADIALDLVACVLGLAAPMMSGVQARDAASFSASSFFALSSKCAANLKHQPLSPPHTLAKSLYH
jgi:hypothetical protein